jgi:predicted acyltransferase
MTITAPISAPAFSGTKKLTDKRVISIDAFRGITILVMVFVNELAGVRNIPQWMKHMPARADAMSFVDIVFPAFLFIVGMSIPFALNNRVLKGDSFLRLQLHIFWRTVGLLVLGLFMVNAEGDYNFRNMPISIHLWSLLFYASVILVWNVYRFEDKKRAALLRGIGIAGLIILAMIYRGGQDGTEYLRPRWWGILGLIGWTYLFTCIFYQLFRGNAIVLLLLVGFCVFVYAITRPYAPPPESHEFRFWDFVGKNASHVAVALCGVILSLIFFNLPGTSTTLRALPAGGSTTPTISTELRNRFLKAFSFALLLFIAGFLLRPYYKISKVYATPTWSLYSAAICCVIFSMLYWIIDIRKWNRWTNFFRPAASNPLLTYIIPDILFSLTMFLHFSLFPSSLRYGIPGILWSAFYAVGIMWIAKGLNKLNIRLQL